MDLHHDPSLNDDLRAVLRFADSISQAHFRLSDIVGTVHGDRQLANASRGVLRFLMAAGPHTVPDIARWRATSRQFIQRIIDDLEAEGLVALKTNPAHRRSRLVDVTRKGRRRVDGMVAREVGLLSEGLARSGASLADIRNATATIHNLTRVVTEMIHELDTGDLK